MNFGSDVHLTRESAGKIEPTESYCPLILHTKLPRCCWLSLAGWLCSSSGDKCPLLNCRLRELNLKWPYIIRRRKWKNLCPCYDNFMPCLFVVLIRSLARNGWCILLYNTAHNTTAIQHSPVSNRVYIIRCSVRRFVPILKLRYIHQVLTHSLLSATNRAMVIAAAATWMAFRW